MYNSKRRETCQKCECMKGCVICMAKCMAARMRYHSVITLQHSSITQLFVLHCFVHAVSAFCINGGTT